MTSEANDPVEEERYEGREDDADPGAYIGRFPERGEETIPGGVQPDDERIAAHSTQGTGAGRPDERGQFAETPDDTAGAADGEGATGFDGPDGGEGR